MSSPISDVALEALSKPLGEARGLPNNAFITPEFLALENRTVFANNWVFAGRKSEVPAPGDIKMTEVGGDPLFMVRDNDGVVRVFFNVCPHRGARLVSEDSTGARAIVCRYHAWGFDLTGALKNQAHFNGPGLHGEFDHQDASCPRLFEVRADFWHDAIFVNLDRTAPPLAEYLAPLSEQAEGFDIEQFQYSDSVVDKFNCNWKLAVENWSDVYHVFSVHPTLNKLMHSAQRTGSTGDGNLIYFRWGYDAETIANDALPPVQGLEGQARTSAFNGHLFPGIAISFHPTMFLFWDFKPISHDWTKLSLHIYYAGEAAQSVKYAAHRQDKAKYYADLNVEDEEVCRLLQEGRQARGYDGGRFSPFWDKGTLHFANLIARSVAQH